jgi:hypothetical protein
MGQEVQAQQTGSSKTPITQVFNPDAALAIREWLREYTDHRLVRSTDGSDNSGSKSDSSSMKRFKPKVPCGLFTVGEEDNSLTKTVKRYNCLVVVGRPGIGKTSCLEAICHEEGRTLQKIDCSQYSSFGEIRKEYTEAVKSQVVEVNTSAMNRQPGTLNCFFTLANCAKGDFPKKQESKVFLITNIEHFLSLQAETEINVDRSTLKSMLDFFKLSRFPFLIKMTKACRNLIDKDLLPEFDFIEYTRPNLDLATSCLDIICKIESLWQLPAVKEIKRFREKDSMQQPTYAALLEHQLDAFESRLENIDQTELERRLQLTPSFDQLRDFICSFDFNFHGIVSHLNYWVQVDKASAKSLDQSLWCLLNDQFVDEYRLKPHRSKECCLPELDASKLVRYPRCLQRYFRQVLSGLHESSAPNGLPLTV